MTVTQTSMTDRMSFYRCYTFVIRYNFRKFFFIVPQKIRINLKLAYIRKHLLKAVAQLCLLAGDGFIAIVIFKYA